MSDGDLFLSFGAFCGSFLLQVLKTSGITLTADADTYGFFLPATKATDTTNTLHTTHILLVPGTRL